ncbi:carboxymuconolactone decarboxylase family protein [Enterobacteriaceae bacterium H11S18]|uniref:carboxymuconolactone decarboxylase family protein n=1 Tax=Dryocola clanedunensis TaxID=2925396 RepID=UPI0022F0CDEF|nr:carboxymuconolactone decarboxylase family protein [Dryocola clanedunensis]MCT4706688.1 carboxymuconolactone decarboxylase family protein [Dryocola clanedunensis]MCT4712215.1 carboxymuconolactone decarboxylase family protein [Dryocola clanedunensis]
MKDWNHFRQETFSSVSTLGKLTPDTMIGVRTIERSSERTDLLGKKVRELIALACAVTTRCEGCIAIHADAAVKAGASDEEIAEALNVAVYMNAGAAVVYSGKVMDAVSQTRK